MERRSERIFGQRYVSRPVKISELNAHLLCVLCGGYYVDATTIIECLHSFCRVCIVRYLERSSRCPICNILVHRAQPLLNIRLDHVLQGLVYKLVPGLLTKEMNDRREFYSRGLPSQAREQMVNRASSRTSLRSTCDRQQWKSGALPNENPIDSESFSISLEYCPSKMITEQKVMAFEEVESSVTGSVQLDLNFSELTDVRYLLCPPGFTVECLKKFIRAKFDLPLVYQIDIYYNNECLENRFSMLDVAFIFQWQKKAPLQLFYSVSYAPRMKRKLTTNNSFNQPHESSGNKQNKNSSNNTISKPERPPNSLSFSSVRSSKKSGSGSLKDSTLPRRKSKSFGVVGSERTKPTNYGIMQKEEQQCLRKEEEQCFSDEAVPLDNMIRKMHPSWTDAEPSTENDEAFSEEGTEEKTQSPLRQKTVDPEFSYSLQPNLKAKLKKKKVPTATLR